MRFGGEVDDGVGPVFAKQACEQVAVADVALHEHVVGVVAQRRQRFRVAGVGELVQVDYAQSVGDSLVHEIAADEAGAAGDEQGFHRTSEGC